MSSWVLYDETLVSLNTFENVRFLNRPFTNVCPLFISLGIFLLGVGRLPPRIPTICKLFEEVCGDIGRRLSRTSITTHTDSVEGYSAALPYRKRRFFNRGRGARLCHCGGRCLSHVIILLCSCLTNNGSRRIESCSYHPVQTHLVDLQAGARRSLNRMSMREVSYL